MDSKIRDRLTRLLAMSQDATSEHEAAIAMRRLHFLLAKHNVSVGDLGEESKEDVGRAGFESIDWPWRRSVLGSVSRLYFCQAYYVKTRKNFANYFIVGTESNRMFAEHICNMVFKTIELEAKIESKKQHGKVVSSFVTSFRNGASSSITRRCSAMITESSNGGMSDDEGNKLPALMSLYDLHLNDAKDYMDNIDGDMTLRNMKFSAKDKAGIAAGLAAGNRVQLSRELHNKSATKQIGRS